MNDDERPDFHHVPVMADRIVELFEDVPAGWYVDATLGGAGHALRILEARDDLRLLGIDQDGDALDAASRRLEIHGDRVRLQRARFDRIGDLIDDIAPEGVSAVLFDLGVSSPQLDRTERGFSFRRSAPLDMRMDQRQSRRAADVVNDYPEGELSRIISKYGDERFSRRIAAAIVRSRPIETTTELAEVVRDAIPAATRRRGGHPATRTFQAIRIEVNAELDVLASALDAAVDRLLPGGRCVALSYHSGEDRIVKDRFTRAETGGCECPPALDCVCGAVSLGRRVRRGVERASDAEIAANPRASSVRLRAFERTAPRDGVAS